MEARMVAVDDGSVPGDTLEEKKATWRYWQQFNLDKYYEGIKEYTFKSEFINLAPKQAKSLALHLQGKDLSKEDTENIKSLTDKLTAIFSQRCYKKAFVKLSTRSPKDAVDKLPHKFVPLLREELKKYPTTSAGEFVAFRQALMEGMAVSSAKEVYELFSYSMRIISDLKRAQEFEEAGETLQIVIREFVSIPLCGELRGFVHNKKLTALSQYYSNCHFPWLIENKETVLKQVQSFHDRVSSSIPFDSYVMDLVVFSDNDNSNNNNNNNNVIIGENVKCQTKVVLVELNPWCEQTGAALYNWQHDLEILNNGPLELRVEMEEKQLRLDNSWSSLLQQAKEPKKPADINDPKYDPFRRHDVPLTNTTEKIKTYLFAVFVLPIRLFFLITWLIVYALVLMVGMAGVDTSKPLPAYAQFVKGKWMILFPYSKYKLIDLMLFAFGFPSVTIYGDPSMVDEVTGERANIMITNHLSYLDILALMSYHETIPSFVSKKEVLKVPLFGWKSRIWQCLYVDRFAPAGGSGGVAAQIDQRAKSFDYPPILIFPEGTTSNGRYILPFKTGAFIGGNPVKPVALKYPYKTFSPAWESMSIFTHLFRLLTQVYNRIEIYFLPVYVPTPEERADPALFASNVRAEIAKVLGVELTNSSVKEKFEYLNLLREAEKQSKQKRD